MTKTGVLFIHGFTGGPYEVEPLVNYVKEQTDWLIALPTLPGHGVTLDLKRTSAQSWLMEAEVAYRQLQKKVDRMIIVGFSMGGLIAMYLALRYRVDKLILLSAAAKYISPRILLEDVRILLTESITKNYTSQTFYHLYNYKLFHTPLRSTFEFLKIVKTVEPYYRYIDCPVCIVQGKKDGIVPFTTAELLKERLGSEEKKIIFSPEGKHHICYSDDCDDWFEEVLEFMKM
ncbi:MAG TPA: alpha/beta fold hydrolase [Sporosarcina sp.]|nr:alpha/beta fold hydrolase [Sporosarcina sp.]